MNKKTQNELLTAEKLVGFCKVVLKIIVKMVFFAIGSFSVIIGGWCVGLIATCLAALVSYPVDEILTFHGTFLVMMAFPISFIFCRICFFSWKLVLVPSSNPFKAGNTVVRIVMEIALGIGAMIAFPSLCAILAILYDYKREDGIGLAIAIVFFIFGGWIMLAIHREIKRFNKEIEVEAKLVSK